MAGGQDFTLIGRPYVDPAHVRVTATVIEEAKSAKVIAFKFRRYACGGSDRVEWSKPSRAGLTAPMGAVRSFRGGGRIWRSRRQAQELEAHARA